MDKASREKIRNYFSDRIEEIKEGTFIPSYDQIKDLPEFSGIKRSAFRIARKKWYKQNLHASFYEFSSRFDKEYEKKYFKEKLKNDLCCLIPGVIFIVYMTFPFVRVLGSIFLVIGIILIWIIYNSIKGKRNKGIKGKRNKVLMAIIIGLIIVILGVLLIVYGVWMGINITWFAGYWFVPAVLGIILMVIGNIVILYNSIKLLGDVSRIISDISFLIPGVILIVMGLFVGVSSRWYGTYWFIVVVPGIIFLVIGIILIIYNSIKKLQKTQQ